MADFEKVPLTKAETLAMMGIPVWYERCASGDVSAGLDQRAAGGHADHPGEADTTADVAPPAATLAEPPAAAATPPPSTAEAAPPAASAEIIEFTWVKGTSGLVVHTLSGDAATLTLLKDVVRFGDWTRKAEPGSGGDRGDFRWPQLVDTSGSPLRALRAFFAKHLDSEAWVGITAEALPQLAPWLGELEIRVVELPALDRNIGDAATKKEIWQRLISLA